MFPFLPVSLQCALQRALRCAAARRSLVFTATLLVTIDSRAATTARIVVFEQDGFPTVESEPVPRSTLVSALGSNAVFADLDHLRLPQTLEGASLIVLPYGSAVPVAAWARIEAFLNAGGNLLLLGGQPLRVPVLGAGPGTFRQEAPQDSYSRVLGFRHSYAVPSTSSPTHFAWRLGYSFLPPVALTPKTVFAQEGRLNGLGYLDTADGTHVAAPVIVVDHPAGSAMPSARIVALPFTPALGFWASPEGVGLIAASARYASAGATSLTLETQYAAIRPGELPELTAHLAGPAQRPGEPVFAAGHLNVELRSGDKIVDRATLPLGVNSSTPLPFHKALPPGLYTVSATWTPSEASAPQEFGDTGFVVEELQALATGPALGTQGDFLTLGGKPFLPVGTNYFTTEENGWDFSGPRNGAMWERDFADMQRHGVNFVRTGVWGGHGRFIEPSTGAVNERFLRNLEAFLAAANRHNIAVNFTFFAFSPSVSDVRRGAGETAPEPTPPNPYLDQGAVEAEHRYVLSVINRFREVPWLSYDLINEPSFSNPRVIFHGNVPNNDPAEVAAWHSWLAKRYSTTAVLADAWRVTAEQLGAFDSIPLPKVKDLTYDRYGNADEVRAFDYNLFAQDMFSGWVTGMVQVAHSAGSTQLINIGQDEGGVTNRVLNQFYATAGLSFTTNHTYWQDDALLWDSVAAKRPGVPNITGETGYQPAWNADGSWRYDELTGTALEERKWAMGFAAGSSRAMQWDWAREVDFGMQRSDGSAKVWQAMMRDMGAFATAAAPLATGLQQPQVAIVLPEALQLSIFNSQALEAQQAAVRALFYLNRMEAYAVGEHATETLGTPKLILLPSPYGLSDKVWKDIEARVRDGATLLISGPFSADEHLHANTRAAKLGLPYALAPLSSRAEMLRAPFGEVALDYPGQRTTMLDRAVLPGGRTWAEASLGKGKVLFSALPIELNSRLESVAQVYAYALKTARVEATYSTELKNPGILICPTRLPRATLYVLASETAASPVKFRDLRSGRTFSGTLEAGRAALLLVGSDGKLLASYNWK